MAEGVREEKIPMDGKLHTLDAGSDFVRIILCYPYDPVRCNDIVSSRVRVLADIGVDALIEYGESRIDGYRILGKGWSAIVTLALVNGRVFVLKSRRIDSRRKGLDYEAMLLEYLSIYRLCPEPHYWDRDHVIMDYIKGTPINKFIDMMIKERSWSKLLHVLKRVIVKAWLMDLLNIDHGELSRAMGHVIINYDLEPYFIDFESARFGRKAHNATSLLSYFVFRTSLKKYISDSSRKRLIMLLRRYKLSYSLYHLLEALEVVAHSLGS